MVTWWFMNLNTFGKLLAFEEVPDVAPKPGLYAWYLRIRLGKSNIESSENFLKALQKITEQICYPTLTMQLQGHLNMNLKGHLKHIWYGHDENPFSDQLQELLNHPEERKVLGDILELTVPLLTGPLYIGVSKNLQERLSRHTELIQRYRQEHQEDLTLDANVDSKDSLQNDEDFARRIVERKIDPNHLVVSVVYVSHPHLSTERIRQAIGTTETLLNRMFYPILGRK
jgi:hypothetical protein